MPSSMVKRGVWALGTAIVVLALIIGLVPFIASTRIVRDRITLEMSAWSGYRVDLGAAPEIDVFPTFHATLNTVTLSEWRDTDRLPVLEAERVEIDLSPLAAMAGNIVFSDMRLIRPTVRVQPKGRLYLPALPGGGGIMRAVEAAKKVVATNPANPDLDKLPSDPFGSIEFTDGRIVADVGDVEVVTSLSGKIDWAAVDGPGKLSAVGIWRGESILLALSSPNPLVLLAGGAAPVSFAVKSNPVSATFEGALNMSADTYLDGEATFNTPSLRRLLEWSQSDIAPTNAIGSINLSSHLTGNAQRAKFDQTEIVLDGSPGMGVLDVSLTGDVPSMAGTLAFETLDLRSLLSAFTPLTSRTGSPVGEIDAGVVKKLAVDLRLSAAQATAGSIGMTDVAATAQVKDGLAVFDISDAKVFGGTLQAGMRLDHGGTAERAELRILASEVDGAILGPATGMAGVVPTGRGVISVTLKGPAQSWETLLNHADGSITANFGSGTIKGIDISAFLERTSQAGFFALGEVAKGELPIAAAELNATLSNGVVQIDKAEVKSEAHDIWLSGLVPYVGGGLALSGKVFPAGADRTATPPEATFFVGGSWNLPFVSPILPSAPPE